MHYSILHKIKDLTNHKGWDMLQFKRHQERIRVDYEKNL